MATLEELETRIAALEKQARKSRRATRRKHEYTQEEKANIKARLLAGQEAARKRREIEQKSKTNGKTTHAARKVVSPAVGDSMKGGTGR